MALGSNTFISDTIKFLRDRLDDNITDPISTVRKTRERFVMTSYPQRTVQYPIITVQVAEISDIRHLGQASEAKLTQFTIEVRVWARNVKERDTLFEQVYDDLRTNQLAGAGTSTNFELFDFTMSPAVPVDEDGEGAPKSLVGHVGYKVILS